MLAQATARPGHYINSRIKVQIVRLEPMWSVENAGTGHPWSIINIVKKGYQQRNNFIKTTTIGNCYIAHRTLTYAITQYKPTLFALH